MSTKEIKKEECLQKGKELITEFEADRYPWWKCILQSTYLLFTLLLWGKLISETVKLHQGPLPTLLGFLISQFLVDFISGLVHWGSDTWGKFTTPIVGPTLIRTFRMHHLDPTDICTHGFIQTNAASSYPIPPFILFSLWTTSDTFLSQTYNWSIIFGVVLGIMTNECHKWAHQAIGKQHPIIRFLQKSGLIISHQKHHVHHTNQFDSSYCIINGWMNPILQYFGFWRKLQAFITKVTGAIPREDDFYFREVKEHDNEKSRDSKKKK